jgi:uncharacterized membrane protein
MSSPPLSPTAKKNVETIARMEQQLVGRRTQTDRICDSIARFFGKLRFIVAHAIIIAIWLILNSGLIPQLRPFDPYPFPFLALIVGVEFICLTAFVLMNQNLQSRREEQWAHLNLQLAILAEHEVTKNMQMLHLICQHLGIKQLAKDDEVKELTQATPVTTLGEEIANRLGETNYAATSGK